jgi:hypothetical protein
VRRTYGDWALRTKVEHYILDEHMRNWILACGYRCELKSMECAAAIGSVECMEWLHNHERVPWNRATMRTAARTGQLHVIEFLHGRAIAWDRTTYGMRAMLQLHIVLAVFV